MKLNKIISEGIFLVGLTGLISCSNKDNNTILKDIEYLNKQDTTIKLDGISESPLEYDSLGRIILMNSNPIKYDEKTGRVSGIGSHKVSYDKNGRVIQNPNYIIKNKIIKN
jgi:hypothetical protein